MSEQPIETAPALGISLKVAVGTGELVFQTHVAQETDPGALNALLDKLAQAADRQLAKAELVQLENNLKVQTDQLARMREDRKRVDEQLTAAQTQPGRRLSGKEQSTLTLQRGQADANEKRMEEIIRDARVEVDKAEARAT